VTFSVLALVAGSAATVGLEEVRYERLTGFLQAQSWTVAAPREARLGKWLAEPGMPVAAGQPLVELVDPALDSRVREQQFVITTLENELARQEAERDARLDQQLLQIHDRIFDARFKAAQSTRVPEHASLTFTVVTTVITDDSDAYPPVVSVPARPGILFTDRGELEDWQTAAAAGSPRNEAASSTEQDLCAQRIAELERLGQELPDKIRRSMGIDLTLARLERARARLAEIEAERNDLILPAPRAGKLGVALKRPGDHVLPHEPVVQILEEDQPYVLLQLPSNRVADFSPGTLVELRFPGGAKGRGRVDEIPPQTLAFPDDGRPLALTYVAAHVLPVGRLWPELPFGSVVDVRIHR